MSVSKSNIIDRAALAFHIKEAKRALLEIHSVQRACRRYAVLCTRAVRRNDVSLDDILAARANVIDHIRRLTAD